MGLSKIISKQEIRIDIHQRGVPNIWTPGIHLHKSKNGNKKEYAEFRVPLDENAKPGKHDSVQLFNEVREILKKNHLLFERLIEEVKDDLSKNFSANDKQLEQAAKNIAGFFSMNFKIEHSSIKLSAWNNKVQRYAVLVNDNGSMMFYVYFRFDKKQISIGENNLKYYEHYIVPRMSNENKTL